MAYNMTFIDTANNLYDVVYNVNLASESIVGIITLTLLFLGAYAFTKQYDTVTSFQISSFVTTIAGGLMMFLGLTPWYIVILPVLLFVASVLVGYFR